MMRVAFLGNHTVGVRVLQAITRRDEVVGVVAHPPDSEDGARYESVYEYATKQRWKVVRGTPKQKKVVRFLEEAGPDLLWITDYRYIVGNHLFDRSFSWQLMSSYLFLHHLHRS
jgi:methionyl-tRNA formyltransferase